MNCRECLELLVDYLEQTLTGNRLASLEEHLRRCPPCADYIHSYQLSIKISQVACHCEEEAEPTEMPEQLVQSIMMIACRKSSPSNPSADASADGSSDHDS